MKKSGLDILVRIVFFGLIIIFISTIMTEAVVAADSNSAGTSTPDDWWWDDTPTTPTTPSTLTNPSGPGQWIWGVWIPARGSNTTDPGTTDPGDAPEDSRFDDDGDGYSENEGDCDDSNCDIYPGAMEKCNDLDDNCNGYVDEGFSAADFYEDADGDGYGNPARVVPGCRAPEGYVINPLDCDDSNPDIHPDSPEICGDGIDQDCDVSDKVCPVDPNDVDDDGDGYSENHGDCNDSDPSIHPGATEICGDGIDQDCNGADEVCASDDGNTPPDAPLALSPNANINTSLTPELIVYEFVDVDGDSHQKTRWQIRLDSNIVIDEITDQQLLSWKVPSECILEKNTQYFWKAIFFDGQDWSAPSNINEFFTGSEGTEFDENGIGKVSIIGPEEEVKLGNEFKDNNGNLITSSTVKAFKSVSNPNVQIGMIVDAGCTIEEICSRRPEDVVAEDISFNEEIPEMPYGMIDFELTVPEKGAVTNVTIYFSEVLAEDFIWWKYDPKIGFYDYAASAYPDTVLYVSSDRKSVVLELKDGGYGDLIEEPDSKIIDPGGVGSAMPTNSSSSGGGGSCFINSLLF